MHALQGVNMVTGDRYWLAIQGLTGYGKSTRGQRTAIMQNGPLTVRDSAPSRHTRRHRQLPARGQAHQFSGASITPAAAPARPLSLPGM